MADLEQRWHAFADKTNLPDPQAIWSAIHTLYTIPDRHYHNLEHIADSLGKLDAWPEPCPERSTIELAIWFHDIIQDNKRNDNEDASAALLTYFLRHHPLESEAASLILATHHKETSGMKPEEIMCDIDLSILGSDPEKYQSYAEGIRKEYDWVPAEEFAEKRAAVLKAFLERENIYHTQHARQLWQEQAQINLKEEITSLLT